MGYTSKTISLITPLLSKVKSVCDLGAQNNYAQPQLPAPYISDWYKSKNIDYLSIDLNGENGSEKWDLSEPVPTDRQFDLVVDAGTGEHVKDFYQCLKNLDSLCKVGGIIYRENPMTGNWPGHGFHYVDSAFYSRLAEKTGYEILHIEEHPAMGNITDGWNVIAIIKKTKEGFVLQNDFPDVFTK